MPAQKIVFFDLETSGLDPKSHAIIQIAAVAVTMPDMEIVGRYEAKIKFSAAKADPVALTGNVYSLIVPFPNRNRILETVRDRAARRSYADRNTPVLNEAEREEFFSYHYVWNDQALDAAMVAKTFANFLRTHATVPKTSKTGNLYNVARLAGHNVTAFDIPFLREWYERLESIGKGVFLPADFFALDTLQMALQNMIFRNAGYKNLKLQTLCQHHGIADEQTHDALDDIYLNVALCRAMCHNIYLVNHISQKGQLREDDILGGLPQEMRQAALGMELPME